jgi:hypothetical protein
MDFAVVICWEFWKPRLGSFTLARELIWILPFHLDTFYQVLSQTSLLIVEAVRSDDVEISER